MRLAQQQLEAHLWGAANLLGGKTAGQDYKNSILSRMFYTRLCDHWENEALLRPLAHARSAASGRDDRHGGRPFRIDCPRLKKG